MIRLFGHLSIVCLVCSSVCAQEASNAPASSRLDEYMETGAEVAGVRVPYYDEEGNLQARLYGGYVKMLEGQVARVTNIRIDVYEHDAVVMTVFAPQCLTRVIEKGEVNILSVESDGDVLIEMDQMTIIGKGFRFTSEKNRFELLSNSKVLVKASARDVKGLGL